MLMYIDEIMNEMDGCQEYAQMILQKFQEHRAPKEILLDVKALTSRIENLETMMPEGTSLGYTGRHLHFMDVWLKKDNLDGCSQDIQDIVNTDLVKARESIKKWTSTLKYVDADLKKEIAPLIRTKQFDSAIRKAFVIFKDRICIKYQILTDEDGQKLINMIFGKNSNYVAELSSDEKQSYRDYFSGLFGLMRNRYAHNNIEATLTELDAVISSINLGLKLIGDFREKSKGLE